jgi:hypothetical protein
LIPVSSLDYSEKEGLKVEKKQETIKIAKSNNIYFYAYNYIREKDG